MDIIKDLKFSGVIFLLAIFFMVSCKNNNNVSSLVELDLMKHGLPIKILAPEGAEIVASDLGFVQDVTVQGTDNYSIQIVGASAHITDMTTLIKDKLEEVKKTPFFTEIIKEDENGFIFMKTIPKDRINYDFRYIKIQGDKEYVFQTGLIGQFSLEEVETMYAAVK